MRFWVEKGCDGYRVSPFSNISISQLIADGRDRPDLERPCIRRCTHQRPPSRMARSTTKRRVSMYLLKIADSSPRLHEFIQEMNREVMSRYDLMTVGELNHTSPDQMMNYVHPDRHELQMGFTFEHVNLGRGGVDMAMVEPHKLSEFKEVIARWQGLREKGGWHALYLENHDQVRFSSPTSGLTGSLGAYQFTGTIHLNIARNRGDYSHSCIPLYGERYTFTKAKRSV
jgi:oligo-1,6-glucosidase